jgi:hypothetical protein
MKEYKFDKTAFKIQTFRESEMSNVTGNDISYAERLRMAYYLNAIAYGFSRNNPPKLDRTFFVSRKQP